jgi:hypothetical protein
MVATMTMRQNDWTLDALSDDLLAHLAYEESQPAERRGCVLQPLDDVLPVAHGAVGDPTGHLAEEVALVRSDELRLDEPADRRALPQHQPHEARSRSGPAGADEAL